MNASIVGRNKRSALRHAGAARRRGATRRNAPSAYCALRSSGQRGYTLLEVIVAFALLAMALALLLGTLSGAAKQVRWSGDAGRAALHAQSLMDQVGVMEPLEPGSKNGELEDGRYRWTIDVQPWRDAALQSSGGPIAPAAPKLVEVQLSMQWGEGGPRERLSLHTLRVAPAGTEARLP